VLGFPHQYVGSSFRALTPILRRFSSHRQLCLKFTSILRFSIGATKPSFDAVAAEVLTIGAGYADTARATGSAHRQGRDPLTDRYAGTKKAGSASAASPILFAGIGQMPEHVLMSEIEIITDGGRRRRWSASEKMRIVEETLEEGTSISVVARRNGVAPNLLYRWRRLMLDGGVVAVSEDDDVTSNRAVWQMEERIRELERQLGRKTLEVEILKEALDKTRSKKLIWLAQSLPKDCSP
jgi:transposase